MLQGGFKGGFKGVLQEVAWCLRVPKGRLKGDLKERLQGGA